LHGGERWRTWSAPGRGRQRAGHEISGEKRMCTMAYYADVQGIPKAGSSVPELILSPYWWNVDALRGDPRLRPADTPGYNDSEGVLSLAELFELNEHMIRLRDARGGPGPHPNVVESMEGFLTVLQDRGDEFDGFLVGVREWESGLG
jgi:hypothetical protein